MPRSIYAGRKIPLPVFKTSNAKPASKAPGPSRPARNPMTAAKKTALQAKVDAGSLKPMKAAILPPMITGNFPFMKLPLELRTEIYRYCLVQEGKTHTILRHGTTGWEEGGKILRLNKEIYNEAAPIFYGENNFQVWTPRGDTYPNISKQNAKFVKEVTIRSGRPFLASNMSALKEFSKLETLNLIHLQSGKMEFGNAPPPPAPGTTVGHFREVCMKSSTNLPHLPEEILDRAREGQLTIKLFVQFTEFNRSLPPVHPVRPAHGVITTSRYHPNWRAGRIDRYELVAVPKTVMPGRQTVVWRGQLGTPYEMVFSGESRVMSDENDDP
ncbi:hypothetical protein FKW77_007216 [Venturia effusa]|uniref:F-box domain-containing protein n=1 Tax=Venturia effusa TaxID=50376 RepID=A0A517LN53_9PEZI|nr:hypothetical protein FKW77_007216 [Venturia effusa]